MKQKSKPVDKSRRRFLSGAAAAGVGGALAAAVPAATTLAATGEEESEPEKGQGIPADAACPGLLQERSQLGGCPNETEKTLQ